MSPTLPSISTRDRAPIRARAHVEARPSLLDRLTERRPPQVDGGVAFAPSRADLRDAVLRDLSWLLNCASLEATDDLAAYPHVRRSVLNFGMRAWAGGRASALDQDGMERAIREAVVQFEPRILAESVEVRCNVHAQSHAILSLEITGQLCPATAPQAFQFRSDIDIESGHVVLRSQEAM
ncbi:type VI secretion system baseplate subunit TssE [Paraburkholderia polaris]|uniref:type VI secretion system baseplate subunit TssE n=1 Tax=Paraburkholderia polaris TaxID=2728848 RepID=UPI002E34E367|nr:type VI secretion system baseplate subunit TssE [Paraburkholderia polaris]